MKYHNKLISKLLKGSLTLAQFNEILQKGDTFFDNVELEKELLLSNGIPLYFDDEMVSLKTLSTKIEDQSFCVVDIETTAGKVSSGQIIEIGAVKIKNGQIIEKYESLVSAHDIPKKVQDITGITPDMLIDAPNIQTVLEEFKIFLEDDIFVAHAISFDYKFISDSLEKYNLGKLLNRNICTIDLSQKLIESERYGLQYLKEHLNIDLADHHRAYSDALSTAKILLECLKRLPEDVRTSEDLIAFSKSNNKKRIKKD
ncbi:MAG: 3'-5' exonuclease [Campylobacterota bacterium]|nr:3'-5' exonuclease [Campylobacterota bacterium]